MNLDIKENYIKYINSNSYSKSLLNYYCQYKSIKINDIFQYQYIYKNKINFKINFKINNIIIIENIIVNNNIKYNFLITEIITKIIYLNLLFINKYINTNNFFETFCYCLTKIFNL
jgi:hypothetical protein